MEYWFKRRRFGWGWTPVRGEGWLTIFLYLLIIVYASVELEPDSQTFWWTIGIATLILLIISFITGELPKWSWG